MSWVHFLLIGSLSMLYAELFAGSSQVWFADLWSVIVTFPLYLLHVLFFLNLAFRTKKTRPSHLYLWGVIFGMYESWITQVLWFGYGDQAPVWGTFLGIGIGEFIPLVFFWHPVMAFVLPVLIFQLMSVSVKRDSEVLPGSLSLLSKPKLKYLYILFAVCSIGTAFNFRGDLVSVLAAFGGTYALIYLLYRRSGRFSVYDLKLGDKGWKIVIALMTVMYIGLFLILGAARGRIPGPEALVSTVALYALFAAIICSIKSAPNSVNALPKQIEDTASLKDYTKASLFSMAMIIFFSFVYNLAGEGLFLLFTVVYVLWSAFAVFLFIKAVLNRNKF